MVSKAIGFSILTHMSFSSREVFSLRKIPLVLLSLLHRSFSYHCNYVMISSSEGFDPLDLDEESSTSNDNNEDPSSSSPSHHLEDDTSIDSPHASDI